MPRSKKAATVVMISSVTTDQHLINRVVNAVIGTVTNSVISRKAGGRAQR